MRYIPNQPTMKHPYQILTSDKQGKYLFAVVKNYLQVFDLATGSKVGEWQDTTETNYQNVQIEKRTGRQITTQQFFNHIKYVLVTPDGRHVVASTDSDKSVLIFSVNHTQPNCLTLSKRQPIPKRPCSLATDNNGNVVVGDKFGDVYVVGVDSAAPVPEKDLVPILGHVSMLTDVIVGTTKNEKQFILTTDRDEHIRVSNYPKSYVIKNFLFGHDEFVSQLYIPEYAPGVLVSGGGDDFVNVWKWHEGELIGSVRVREYVEEYLTKESHLPPARFRHEDSPKEISIARIVSLKNDEGVHLLLVLVENTPCVLVFDVNDDFSMVEYKQTVLAPGSIVDFTLAGSMIVASVESEDPVKFFSLQDDGKFKEVEGAKIADAIPFDVENESEFQHLYKYYQLRKRSDSAEAS